MYGKVTMTRKMDRKDRLMKPIAQSRKHLASTSFLDAEGVRVHATSGAMLWLPKTAAHILLLASRCKTPR